MKEIKELLTQEMVAIATDIIFRQNEFAKLEYELLDDYWLPYLDYLDTEEERKKYVLAVKEHIKLFMEGGDLSHGSNELLDYYFQMWDVFALRTGIDRNIFIRAKLPVGETVSNQIKKALSDILPFYRKDKTIKNEPCMIYAKKIMSNVKLLLAFDKGTNKWPSLSIDFGIFINSRIVYIRAIHDLSNGAACIYYGRNELYEGEMERRKALKDELIDLLHNFALFSPIIEDRIRKVITNYYETEKQMYEK